MIKAAPRRMTAALSAAIQEALVEVPMTYERIAQVYGLSKTSVARWVKSMRDPVKRIYIADWAPDVNGRVFVPMWAWGRRTDAERPGPKRTDAERMRAHRAKTKTTS